MLRQNVYCLASGCGGNITRKRATNQTRFLLTVNGGARKTPVRVEHIIGSNPTEAIYSGTNAIRRHGSWNVKHCYETIMMTSMCAG